MLLLYLKERIPYILNVYYYPKILMHFLPYKGKQWFYNNQQMFYILFLLIWITGLHSVIITPIINGVAMGMEWVVYNIFKVLTLM
jgi:hypothetical protein